MLLVALGPRRIPAWIWPVGGALVLVALKTESLPAAVLSITSNWNVLLFIAALMAISAAADESGLFGWIAGIIVAHAKGSRAKLFSYLFLGGALLTIVMSNDTTAVVFTPIVYRAVSGCGLSVLPFLYACTFVADTASFGFPFSNPANILVLPRPELISFMLHLTIPMLVAVALNLAIFRFIFRRALEGDYELPLPPPLDPRTRNVLIAMAIVALLYFLAVGFDISLGPTAALGAVIVLASARANPRIVIARVSWTTLVLLCGLFVLLDAVEHQGAIVWVLRGLHDAAHSGAFGEILSAAFGAALASNLINNLPVAALSGTIVAQAGHSLAYPLIAGADVGPNLSTTGSLATILWLSIVRERGLHVSRREYARLGLCVVPPTLLFTCLWLWLVR
ncbi:MAG: SLC13 family permease [Vulcanimicrobiaceae bacterium]|jgi:arsenical pump membrane protein